MSSFLPVNSETRQGVSFAYHFPMLVEERGVELCSNEKDIVVTQIKVEMKGL